MSEDLPAAAATDKALSPTAIRALKEAEIRKEKTASHIDALPPEKAGPKGAEPTRFGDWERGGIAYDF